MCRVVADCHSDKLNKCSAVAEMATIWPHTMWPGPRSTSVPSGIFVHPDVWPQQTWAENWGLCPFLGKGSVPI